jgi:hypothetical protein
MNTRQFSDTLAHDLQGTCNSLYRHIDSLEEEVQTFFYENETIILEYLDNLIFECDTCGWWCEMSEAVETDTGSVCDQCKPEELDND